MKRIITYLYIFITFYILYFLQSNFFSWFTIVGIEPNIFIILTVIVGLFAGRNIGMVCGILFGFLLDMYLGRSIGITALMLGVIGWMGGYIDKNFSKEGRIFIILIIILSTFIFETGKYGIECIIYKMTFQIKAFFTMLSIEVLYNVLLSVIFYKLIVKLGYSMEDTIKGKNILTRYF